MAKKKNGWVREKGRWVLYVNGKRSKSQIQVPSAVKELGGRFKKLPGDLKTIAGNAVKDVKNSAKHLTYQDNATSGSPKTKGQAAASTPTSTSKKRGMSNIPSKEGTGGKAETELKYGSKAPRVTKPTPTPTPTPKPRATPTPKSKPIPKTKPRMESASGTDRMATWAKANRKMIEKSGTKAQKKILADALKKKKPQSAANKAGWSGNRNY